ncbi:MAG: 5'-nucleotidase C-terminal domain-containing protein [Pseudomonadota bacterium]
MSAQTRISAVLTAMILVGASSCRTTPSGSTSPTSAPAQVVQASAEPFELPILFTSDEHGWLEPHLSDEGRAYEGGMAYLLGHWKGAFDYKPERFLVLSGGDAWTGPYESTVLHGAPVVAFMNLAGYDAQIIGNHDFDFGADVLLTRAREAHYPLLAANLHRVSSTVRPPYAVGQAVSHVNGRRIGIVGLANLDTPVVTHPRNVAGLAFSPLEGALRREVAALRATAVDVVVAVIHEPVEELLPLVPVFRELGISFVGSGHSHHRGLTVDPGSDPTTADDVVVCNPGPYARAFCHVTLRFAGQPPRLMGHDEDIVQVRGRIDAPTYPPDEAALAIVQHARDSASSAGAEVLASTAQGLSRGDPDQRLGHLVVDAWLEALPQAQVAITNAGGLRQDIDVGDISMRTLVGVLPFDNYLLLVELTGAQLKKILAHPQTIAGGVRFRYRCNGDGTRQVIEVRDLNNKLLDDDKPYRVVVNEFIYRGGDRYRIREFDPHPEETALHWREPVARHLRQLTRDGKTADLPIDGRARPTDEGSGCQPKD